MLKHHPEDMANILQSQYTSVFSNPLSPDINRDANNIKTAESELSNINISQEDIIAAIDEIDPYAATSDGDIPAKILKSCKTTLSRPITILWDKSFSAGLIPAKLKEQFITPIFKKGNKTDPGNYRPISLTSHIIKNI